MSRRMDAGEQILMSARMYQTNDSCRYERCIRRWRTLARIDKVCIMKIISPSNSCSRQMFWTAIPHLSKICIQFVQIAGKLCVFCFPFRSFYFFLARQPPMATPVRTPVNLAQRLQKLMHLVPLQYSGRELIC